MICFELRMEASHYFICSAAKIVHHSLSHKFLPTQFKFALNQKHFLCLEKSRPSFICDVMSGLFWPFLSLSNFLSLSLSFFFFFFNSGFFLLLGFPRLSTSCMRPYLERATASHRCGVCSCAIASRSVRDRKRHMSPGLLFE